MSKKRHVESGAPREWDAPESDDEARRQANRERVARGKGPKSAPVSRNPQIADSKRDRWQSRQRQMKAAALGREVKKSE